MPPRPETLERARLLVGCETLDEAVSQMGAEEVKRAIKKLRRWHGGHAVKVMDGALVVDPVARRAVLGV